MSPTRLSNLTIVVEDHNDTRSFLRIFLSHLGAKVAVAEADPSTKTNDRGGRETRNDKIATGLRAR